MKDVPEEIKRKILKIKQAMDTGGLGNDNEAQSYAAMLQKLMMKYRLSEADVTREMLVGDIVSVMIRDERFPLKLRRCPWTERLGLVLAEHFSCHLHVVKGYNAITFVGRTEDVSMCKYLFVYLYRIAVDVCGKKYALAKKRGFHTEFKKTFYYAFCKGLNKKLEESKAEFTGDESAALVWISQKYNEAINLWEKYKNVRQSECLPSGISSVNKLAAENGYEAGRNVQLNKPIEHDKLKMLA